MNSTLFVPQYWRQLLFLVEGFKTHELWGQKGEKVSSEL
jgi:hypothetical protein